MDEHEQGTHDTERRPHNRPPGRGRRALAALLGGLGWLGLVAPSGLAAGCSDSVGPRPCNPGATDPCTCDAGQGTRVCGDDHIWGPCVCPMPCDADCCGADCDAVCDGTCPGEAPRSVEQDGVCAGLLQVCNPATCTWQEPELATAGIEGYEEDETTCDGLDNDCDDETDEGCEFPPPVCEGPGPYPLGCECRGPDDCVDEVCVETESGRRVCGRYCVDACPRCWQCLTIINPGQDPMTVCVPEFAQGCPCLGDCPGTTPVALLHVGVCADAEQTCDPDTCAWQEPDYGLIPGYEPEETSCDGEDNDCDGETDEGFAGVPEVCADSVDNDCDGDTDETGCVPPCDGTCEGEAPRALKQLGVCEDSAQVCDPATCTWQEPDYATTVAFYEADETTCDAADNDCDGDTDEGVRLAFFPDADGDGCGRPAEPLLACQAPPGYAADDCDCDDDDLAVAETLPEVCDTKDNDCDGDTDEGCDTACAGDAGCPAGFFCDAAAAQPVCVPRLGPGALCDRAAMCASEHCQNGFCCAAGDCCATAANCPAAFTSPANCDDPATCQGTRQDAACVDFACDVVAVDDDSACDAATLADECGPYLAVYCNGTEDQAPPVCPDSCVGDEECDPEAFCDSPGPDGQCVWDMETCAACTAGAQCLSNNCRQALDGARYCVPAGAACANPAAPESECGMAAGQAVCAGNASRECTEGGTFAERICAAPDPSVFCSAESVCLPDTGRCGLPPACTPCDEQPDGWHGACENGACVAFFYPLPPGETWTNVTSEPVAAPEGCGTPESPCNPNGPTFRWVPDSGVGACRDADGVGPCPGAAGEEACYYTPFCGQDAQYGWDADPALAAWRTERFQLSGFEPQQIVADLWTGLTWTHDLPGAEDTWQGALDFCDALVWGGREDWRLPDVFELSSLLDYGYVSAHVASSFPAMRTGNYWTSSTYLGNVLEGRDGAWEVIVSGYADSPWGAVNPAALWVEPDLPTTRRFLCVASAPDAARPPACRFYLTEPTPAQSVVFDARTNLLWDRTAVTLPQVTAEDALATCERSTRAGRQDWRLPSVMELLSLFDSARADTIDPDAFAGGPAGSYWSSTPSLGYEPSHYYRVNYSSIYDAVNRASADTALFARCVALGPTCTPDCTGRECGSNGCGGSCGGSCGGHACSADGQLQWAGLTCSDTDCPELPGYCVACNVKDHCEYTRHEQTELWHQWDVWIYLPPRPFQMGSPEDEPGRRSSEGPQHWVTCSDGFLIAKYEITVAGYETCEAEGTCSPPSVAGDDRVRRGVNRSANGRSSHPQNGIEFEEARDFCQWFGGRLPSEPEWEYAANGPGPHHKYPWGDFPEPDCDHAVFDPDGDTALPFACEPCLEEGCSGTQPVGSRPAGASGVGAMDMAGNLNEVVAGGYHETYEGSPPGCQPWEWLEPDPPVIFPIVRSTGFVMPWDFLRTSSRLGNNGPYYNFGHGARCVRDLP